MKLFYTLLISLIFFASSSTCFSAPKFFRTLGLQIEASELYYSLNGKDVPIQIRRSARSQFYELKPSSLSRETDKGEFLVFYLLRKNEDGKEVRVPVAKADVANAGNWALIAFHKAAKDDDTRLIASALSDDVSRFPAPDIRFFNLTNETLLLNFDESKSAIPANQSTTMKPSLNSDSAEIKPVYIGIKTQKNIELVYSNNWVVRPNIRTLVLIFPLNGTFHFERVVEDVGAYMTPL